MFEDLAVVLGFFAATTTVGVAYALSKTLRTVKTSGEKKVIVLQSSELPAQVDTRFSKLVLEAEEKVRIVEEKVEQLLKEFGGDDDGR